MCFLKTERYTASVITVSDKASEGLREDKSGPLAVKLLEEMGFSVVKTETVSDERSGIEAALIRHADEGISLVITSGGTGAAPRDNTPEATLAVAEREMPGLAELMRISGMKYTPLSVLSRGRSVIRGGTLIINLPGNPKAVSENLEILEPVLGHALKMLSGTDLEHQSSI